jgi:hypothetical protein
MAENTSTRPASPAQSAILPMAPSGLPMNGLIGKEVTHV